MKTYKSAFFLTTMTKFCNRNVKNCTFVYCHYIYKNYKRIKIVNIGSVSLQFYKYSDSKQSYVFFTFQLQ